jgi:hypothetical protein
MPQGARRPQKAENRVPEPELRYRLKLKRTEQFGTALYGLIKWGSIAFIAYQTRMAAVAFAGENTAATLALSIIGDIKTTHGIYITISGLSVVFGLRERHLRRLNSKNMGGHIERLEKLIDPNRTSSGITKSGTTRPEDKDPA